MEQLRAIFRTGLFALAIAGLTVSADAGRYEDGMAAYRRGDYPTALRLIRPLAEQGVAEAQASLGAWFESGAGVPQDHAEAAKWYRRAAEQGNAHAQVNLGLIYYNGQGVPQDYAEAVKWWRRAAEQGVAEAQSNLGIMYAMGRGVPKDYVSAQMWFSLATAEGDDKAQEYRDFVAGMITPRQHAKAQRMAREWRAKRQ